MSTATAQATQRKQISVTWNQVAAFRLLRHHLSARAPTKALLSVVRDMAGAQAQLLSAAHISLWSRVRDLEVAHVEEAISKRTLVKASCMRRTLFLVPSKHLAVFVRGTARRAEKEIRWTRGKGVPDRVIDAAIDATVPVGDITFPVVDLLHLVAARGVVCYGPSRGNEPTFVRADAWIPHWRDIPREQAESILLRRYLQAFGPATATDFSLWSGISLTEAREVWAREQANFASVDVEGWTAAVLRKDLDELAQAEFEHPLIRLLPYFDTFLLGHKERDHLVAVDHRPKIYRAQGWISPVVLADGRVTAIWEQAREGSRLHVKVEKFGTLARGVAAGIREEARDLGRFLGTPHVDVQIG